MFNVLCLGLHANIYFFFCSFLVDLVALSCTHDNDIDNINAGIRDCLANKLLKQSMDLNGFECEWGVGGEWWNAGCGALWRIFK